MDIRKWFCSEPASSTESDSCFNKLLELYAEALNRYFSIYESSDIRDLIEKAKNSELSEEQQLFVDWFQEFGLPTLQSILEKKLPNDPDFIAQIEYEHYILSEEMISGSPEDIRSALVNIVVDLPTRIELAATGSVVIEVTDDLYNIRGIISDIQYDDILEDTLPMRRGILFSEGNFSINVESLKSYRMAGGMYSIMRYEEYELIRSQVQLTNVYLHELRVKRCNGNDNKLRLRVLYSHDNHHGNSMDIYMKVEIDFMDNGPFELTCVYKGELKASDTLEDDEFVKFAEAHAVPFLLPYVRECISSTLARMQLPIYMLPTIDILESMRSFDVKDEG